MWYTTTMGEELVPKPKKLVGRQALSKEKKDMLLESAALAYVQMEHGDYKYPPGVRKGFKDDEGVPTPNTVEVMRRAGYGKGSQHHFSEYLEPNGDFWKLVELYRLRYTDPMFAKERENSLFKEVGNESLRHLYERVRYEGHKMSTENHIRIVKLILDAGITFSKLQKGESKADKLLRSIQDPDKRSELLEGYKNKLQQELRAIEHMGDTEVQDMPVSGSGMGVRDEGEWGDEDVSGDLVQDSEHIQES